MGIVNTTRARLARQVRSALITLTSSLPKIIVVYILSLLVAAVLFSIFEQRSFLDSLWWAVVTALTIGYGDISPESIGGRAVSIVFQHFWIFGVAPLIIANILMHVIYDENQFSHEEQEWQAASLRLIAEKLEVELPPEPAATTYIDTGEGN